MKKIIALSAILSMSAAFADDVVYGTFVLNSSEPEVVLCVPWINPGSENGAVPVKDLIQTSTLEAGDQLFYYVNGGYKAWVIENGAWVGAQVVKGENGSKIDASKGAEETLVRGNAVILKRPGVESRLNKDIIINGQVGSGSATMTMARVEGIAYSLIAPANPDADTSINSGTWTGVTKKDRLFIGITPYYWSGEYWGSVESKLVFDPNGVNPPTREDTVTRVDAKIPAGKGAWFMAQGESTTTTWDPKGNSNL